MNEMENQKSTTSNTTEQETYLPLEEVLELLGVSELEGDHYTLSILIQVVSGSVKAKSRGRQWVRDNRITILADYNRLLDLY